MSKPSLWKRCKELALAFDKPYAALTCEELTKALEQAKAPSIPTKDQKVRTPTEEEMKITAVQKTTKAMKLQVRELKAAAAAAKAQKSLDAIMAQTALTAAAEARKAQRDLEIAAEEAQNITETEVLSEYDELLADAKEIEVEGKPFRLQNQRFFLTYKTHIDKEQLASFFAEKNVKECICAHENADESSPYEHTHVYVDFGRNYQSTNARVFDFQKIHPNIKAIKSSKHLENIWAYLCKEDTANEYLLERITKKTLYDKVSACKNIHEVMRLARTPNEASGLATMYALREKETFEPKPLEHIWQKELLEELATTPNERKIVWYYDNVGNTGKSTFARYVQAKGLATVMSQLGGDRDSGQLIETARDSGWDGRAIIIDLPRQGEHRSIYSPLESIKNGLVTNVKYKGGTTTYPSPHLVVMANFLPRIHEMSLDRWDIRELVVEQPFPDAVISVRELNVHDVDRRVRECANVNELKEELMRRCHGCATKRDLLQNLLDNVQHELRALNEQ